ncbi:Transcription factor RFX4 [Halotydeus destructor]|nr:Transcription factor RFX4 [Halotydeus destructor]
MSSMSIRKNSVTEYILNWLNTNYELIEGICVPRSLLYEHYAQSCQQSKIEPIGAAAFGKSQSRSAYLDEKFIKEKKTRPKSKGVHEDENAKIAQIMKDFPDCDKLNLPDHIDSNKMATFLIMYRTHCNQLLDIYSNGKFKEVQMYIGHFWTSIPEHLISLMQLEFTSLVVKCCDNLFYESLEVLLLEPDRLCSNESLDHLQHMCENLLEWNRDAILFTPEPLSSTRSKVLSNFVQAVQRHLALCPFIKSCSLIVNQENGVQLMIGELQQIDLMTIFEDLELCPGYSSNNTIKSLITFLTALDKHSISDILSFAKHLIECSMRNINYSCKMSKATSILFTISRTFASLSRELTLNGAKSFGYWHLVFTLINDYSLIIVNKESERESNAFNCLSLSKKFHGTEYVLEDDCLLRIL